MDLNAATDEALSARQTLRNLLKEQGVQADSFGSYELANPADFDVLIFGRTSDSAMQALTSINLQALDVGEFVVCSGTNSLRVKTTKCADVLQP